MVRLLAPVLLFELRFALRLAGVVGGRWRWLLAPLWLLLAMTFMALAGSAAIEHRWRAVARLARPRADDHVQRPERLS
jgi:hypothetical protein